MKIDVCSLDRWSIFLIDDEHRCQALVRRLVARDNDQAASRYSGISELGSSEMTQEDSLTIH